MSSVEQGTVKIYTWWSTFVHKAGRLVHMPAAINTTRMIALC